MQLVGYFAGIARRLPAAEISLGCGWLIVLAILEFTGRRFTSDVADGVALLGVTMLVHLTKVLHKRRNLQAVAIIRKGLQSLSHTFWQSTIEVGADLTRFPPLPRGFPPKWWWVLALLAMLVPGLIMFAPEFPSAARAALAAHFYLIWLTLEGLLWSTLAFGIVLHSVLAWARLHDWFVERHREQRPRSIRTEVRATLAMFLLLLGGAVALPLWIPITVQALFIVTASAALLMSRPGLELVWRYRSGGPVRVFDGRWLYWTHCTGSCLLALVLIVIAGGETLWESALFQPSGSAPVTSLLGRMFAWMSMAGNFVAVYYSARFAIQGMLFHQHQSLSDRGPASSPEDRRSEIRARREIIRRLKMLLRRAARQSGPRGTGFWIGLQHWFILGLSWDNDGSEGFDRETTIFDDIVGPPYHQVFTRNSRRHFLRVTTALKIDLIFVENGVGFQRLVRVLRMMFEVYDVYGGRQRAEERHFTGLPGVRVLFHDLEMCDSSQHGRDRYPEPDYEQIGRARILHVFRDRGESDDGAPVPESWEGVPVTSGV